MYSCGVGTRSSTRHITPQCHVWSFFLSMTRSWSSPPQIFERGIYLFFLSEKLNIGWKLITILELMILIFKFKKLKIESCNTCFETKVRIDGSGLTSRFFFLIKKIRNRSWSNLVWHRRTDKPIRFRFDRNRTTMRVGENTVACSRYNWDQ